ncbi:MAG: hypothetical protein ABI638_10905 [Ignavibacteriota bacterium]
MLSLNLIAQDRFYTKGLANGYAWTDRNSTSTLAYSKRESLGKMLPYNMVRPNKETPINQESIRRKISFPLECEDDVRELAKTNEEEMIDIGIMVTMIDEFYKAQENLIIPVLGAYCCSVKKLAGVSVDEIEIYKNKLIEYSKK